MTNHAKQWVTIGTLDDISDPAIARARARDILMSQRDGMAFVDIGPDHAEKALERDRLHARVQSVNNAFSMRLPLYLYYCEYKKRNRNLPATVLDKTQRLTKHVEPRWGKKDISTITRKDVMQLFDDLSHVPGSAYQVYAMLNDFFKWAVNQEFITVNPMAGMGPPFKPRERDRYLSDDEIRWFWRACDDLGWPFGLWAKMLLLTCQRCTEVSNMSRFAIDRHFVWTLPANMTKSRRPHIVPLSSFAQDVFQNIPEVDRTGHVFGREGNLNRGTKKERLDALMLQYCRDELAAAGAPNYRYASIEPWVFHDLRRTGATIMAKLKHPKDVVHKVLNHSDGGGRSRSLATLDRIYIQYEYLEERQRALEDLGKYVEQLVSGING